jgi:hypothetical protein
LRHDGADSGDYDNYSGSGDGGGDGCSSLAEEGRGPQGWMCRVLSDGGRQKIAMPFGDFTQQRGAMFLMLS